MEQGFYEDAKIYDILHAPGTAEEVDGLERIEARFASGRGAWLEPACGSARCLRVAAMRGRRVVGYDLEPGMIAFAREAMNRRGVGRRATLLVGSMEDAGLLGPASCGFAFNLINTIRHLGSDAAVRRHFGQVARALAPGGVYAVGLGTTTPGWAPVEDVWEGARGRVRVLQTVQYLPPEGRSRWERVISHVQVSTPRTERHLDSVYRLRTYTLGQWLGVIERSALRLIATVDERGRDIERPEHGYAVWVLGAEETGR